MNAYMNGRKEGWMEERKKERKEVQKGWQAERRREGKGIDGWVKATKQTFLLAAIL